MANPQGVRQPFQPHQVELAVEEYVFAIRSDAFPEYIKIGRTTDIFEHLSAINVHMPMQPFYLVAYFKAYDPKRDKAKTHLHFAGSYLDLPSAQILQDRQV